MKAFLKKIIPPRIMALYYASWSVFGSLLYRNPSAHIKVIGVTGTNGKTSVAHITADLFQQAGVPAASISTVRFKIQDKEWTNQFRLTMPGRLHVQKFFRQAVDAGCKVVVIEVTSEGIVQKRHAGITFDTVVFTNLTPEHIERHGSFEAYRSAKVQLFSVPHRVAIVNADDEHSRHFVDATNSRTILYSKTADIKPSKQANELLQALHITSNSKGISFDIQGIRFQAPLLGMFNIENSLAAIGVCVGYGLSLEDIARSFKQVRPIPGRSEIVAQEPTMIVDYAHTPDGLEKMYEMVRSVNSKQGRIISVLGSAGGGRDKWKRPEMGKIVGENCDVVILTNEDPYNEDPLAILEGIRSGVEDKTKVQIILDRREAIRKALEVAREEDIIAISGKGSDPGIIVAGGKRLEWDDRQVAREEWERVYTEHS